MHNLLEFLGNVCFMETLWEIDPAGCYNFYFEVWKCCSKMHYKISFFLLLQKMSSLYLWTWLSWYLGVLNLKSTKVYSPQGCNIYDLLFCICYFFQNGADATILDIDGMLAIDHTPAGSETRQVIQNHLEQNCKRNTKYCSLVGTQIYTRDPRTYAIFIPAWGSIWRSSGFVM